MQEKKLNRFKVIKVDSEVVQENHDSKPTKKTEKKPEPFITDQMLDQIGTGILDFVNQQVNGSTE